MTIIALVLAQNALEGNLQRGSGAALDAPLQQGVRFNAPSTRPDYRSRNLVVTGDVAGGRGFRGSVGYTASGDFRGATSGDVTRNFRANSSITSADAIASIPMNDRFSVATGMGAMAYRRDFSTAGLGGKVSDTSHAGWDSGLVTPAARAATNNSRLQLDMFMRQSATSADLSSMYQPSTVTVTRTADQRSARIIASPFIGIAAVPNNDLIESLSLGVYGSALMRADLRSGRVNGKKLLRSYLSGLTDDPSGAAALATEAKLDAKIPSGAVGAIVPPTEKDSGVRQVAEIRTPYDRVLSAVGNRYRQSKGEKVEIDTPVDVSSLRETGEIIQGLRDGFQMSSTELAEEKARLLGTRITPETQSEKDAASTQSGSAAATATEDLRSPGGSKSTESSSGTSKDGDLPPARRITADEAYLLMAHGQSMSQLDGGSKEALDLMLQSGDAAMRAKQYLTAEKAFIAGVLIAPSNPLPIAGMANSQVAAGLQVSAAVTLRRLFSTWPEMIDTRYGLDILGSADRLRKIGEESLVMSQGSKYAIDYGLVAAYVGHQLGDATLMERGIAIMDRDPNERALTEALRGIWLRPAPAPAAPAPAAPAPAAPAPAAPAPVTGEVRP